LTFPGAALLGADDTEFLATSEMKRELFIMLAEEKGSQLRKE